LSPQLYARHRGPRDQRAEQDINFVEKLSVGTSLQAFSHAMSLLLRAKSSMPQKSPEYPFEATRQVAATTEGAGMTRPAAGRVGARNYADLRPSQKRARGRALQAIGQMRQGESLTRATAKAHTTPRTVKRWLESELTRTDSGRYSVTKGDRVFYYHTGSEKSIVVVMEVVNGPYPDPNGDDARLVVVDVKPVRRLPRSVSLAEIKSDPKFADFALVRISRLSVMRVTDEQWAEIERLSNQAP
jgi:hypothetical protein